MEQLLYLQPLPLSRFYCRRAAFQLKKSFCGSFFVIFCNIFAACAIKPVAMVGVMAEIDKRTDIDALVVLARANGDALGRLYELYYGRIFRFCVYRLFSKDVAEDVTSTVFLEVARKIRSFTGRTEADFRNWIYAVAVNQANAYVRKTSRRSRLLEQAAGSIATKADRPEHQSNPDWPKLYSAILRLKPKHQTIVTLRFFENLEFEQIGKIINAREATVRVMLHRILKKLRDHLQSIVDGGA